MEMRSNSISWSTLANWAWSGCAVCQVGGLELVRCWRKIQWVAALTPLRRPGWPPRRRLKVGGESDTGRVLSWMEERRM